MQGDRPVGPPSQSSYFAEILLEEVVEFGVVSPVGLTATLGIGLS